MTYELSNVAMTVSKLSTAMGYEYSCTENSACIFGDELIFVVQTLNYKRLNSNLEHSQSNASLLRSSMKQRQSTLHSAHRRLFLY